MRTRKIANDTKTSELDNQWAVVMHFLPQGWQDAAWTYGAITRLRAIQSAEALLRLIFAYAWNDWSLRTTANRVSGHLRCGRPQAVTPRVRVARLHAQWNLGTGRWEHVELTDTHGAESLTRLRLRLDDVVLAERHDAKPPALAWIVAQKAYVIVRFGWNALRLQTLNGEPWTLRNAVRGLRDATPGEWWVQIPGTKDRPADAG